MKNVSKIVFSGVLFPIFFVGCSIKAPEVRVTGEKTALEREVVGTYQSMSEDTWMIASTRAAQGEQTVTLSPEKEKVLQAMQQQKFNKDDIIEFKKNAWIGENNTGFLEVRVSKELESDPNKLKLVQEIIEEENHDRGIIMDRVIELNASLKKSVRDDVLVIFAKMNQDNSPSGTWIQLVNGKWKKK